jgi:hypothetical protein
MSLHRDRVGHLTRLLALIALLLAMLVLAGLPGARADGHVIGCDTQELIEAIGEPSATIELAADCTYELTEVDNEIFGPTGLPVIASAITIVGENSTITRDSDADPFRIFAVAATGSLTLDGVTVSNGHASGDGLAVFGGGIYSLGMLELTGSTVSGNQASSGGGLLLDNSSSAIIINTTVSGNTGSFGGGLVLLSSNATIINTTVSGNEAITGGGLFLLSSSATLTNTTIAGNKATGDGGGLRINNSSATIHNSIVWGNAAAGSAGTDALSVVLDGSADLDYSMIDDDACGNAKVDCDNAVAGPPSFVDPVDASEAPTSDGDYRLLLGSPAIDAGSNANYEAAFVPLSIDPLETDRDGNPRIVNDVIDLGAYEFQSTDPDPAELLDDLLDDVGEMEIQHGVTNALTSILTAAQDSLASGETATACDELQAAANLVAAQYGKHISADDADELLEQIAAIREALGC